MRVRAAAFQHEAAWPHSRSGLTSGQIAMQMYQHDSSDMFRIVLIGELGESGVRQLRWAWETAKSILRGKELSVDVSAVTKADPTAVDLLSRMRESGARITAARQPECEELLRLFDNPAPAPRGGGRKRRWALRILKAARFFA